MTKLLTVEELAKYLDVTVDTIYRKAREGEIPGIRVGRVWRFSKEIIDEWLRKKVEEVKNNKK